MAHPPKTLATETWRSGHRWRRDRCARCGLRRTEAWVLDDEGRAVMALVWFDAAGKPVRAVQFAWLTGLEPPAPPRLTLAQAYPRVPLGREPDCHPTTV